MNYHCKHCGPGKPVIPGGDVCFDCYTWGAAHAQQRAAGPDLAVTPRSGLYAMIAAGEITEEISAQHDVPFDLIARLRYQHAASTARPAATTGAEVTTMLDQLVYHAGRGDRDGLAAGLFKDILTAFAALQGTLSLELGHKVQENEALRAALEPFAQLGTMTTEGRPIRDLIESARAALTPGA